MRRVDEAIRQVIGDTLASEVQDPRVGFVTVTDVKTSSDLRHARVYVSVLDDLRPARSSSPAAAAADSPREDADAREQTLAALRHAHGFLQARIAGELRLKRTPTLEFSYDDTSERAMRLDALIDEVSGQ